jgi:hypothetical protein
MDLCSASIGPIRHHRKINGPLATVSGQGGQINRAEQQVSTQLKSESFPAFNYLLELSRITLFARLLSPLSFLFLMPLSGNGRERHQKSWLRVCN